MQHSADLHIIQLLHSAWKGSAEPAPLEHPEEPIPKQYCGVKAQGDSLATTYYIGGLTYLLPPLS